MIIESPARARDAAPPAIGSDELAEGLLLVRASTLKMIRLQLAMERQDRRVALEAVDDLVALDRRLQDYLAEVPAAGEQLLFTQALETERSMLNREKLTLAAEIVRRDLRPDPIDAPLPTEVAVPEPAVWDDLDFTPNEERRPHRAILWLALVLALLAAAAGGAWMWLGPGRVAELAGQIGALR